MAIINNNEGRSRRVIIAVLVFALLGSVAGSLLWQQLRGGSQEDSQEDSREGLQQLLRQYVEAGQLDEAFRLLDQALQQDPEDKGLQRELENVLAQKRQYQQIGRAKQLEGVGSREGLKQLLEKYVVAGQFEEAFRLLNQALQQDPGDEELQRELENILAEKQQYDREQKEAAERSQRELVKDLLKQNLELQSRTDSLWQQLAQREQNQQQQTQLGKQDSSQNAQVAARGAEGNPLQDLDGAARKPDVLRQVEGRQRRESVAEQTEKGPPETDAYTTPRSGAVIVDKLASPHSESNKDSESNKAGGIEPQPSEDAAETYSALRQDEAIASLTPSLDEQNRSEEAMKVYNDALERSPDPFDSELSYLRGIALYHLGKYLEAAENFHKYIEGGGQNLRARYALGLSYRQLSRDREAKRAFQEAIAEGLNHAPTYWELSKLELEQLQAEEALEYVGEALALRKHDSRYLQTKGAALFQLQRYAEAAVAYKQADKADMAKSERAQVSYNMGLSYYNSGQYAQAITAFGQAVSLDASKPEYVLGLADAQTALGKSGEALKVISSAQQKLPDNGDLLLTQGNIYFKAQKYQQALAVFQRAYEQNPKDRKVINNLGLAYMNTGNFDQSRDFFRQALAGDPHNSDLWFNLALVDVVTEQHDAAIGNLEKTLSLNSGMGQAYYLLTKEYLAVGRQDKARDTLERLRRVDPGSSQIVDLERLLAQ